MSMPTVISYVFGRGCLLWPVRSLGKTVNLCPASFCIPRSNLPVTPGISWFLTFAFQAPMMKTTSFCVCVLVLGLVGLLRTFQLQVFKHSWLGHRLGLLWHWMACLVNGQRSFCFFEIVPKHCILDSFTDYEGYSVSSKGFLS